MTTSYVVSDGSDTGEKLTLPTVKSSVFVAQTVAVPQVKGATLYKYGYAIAGEEPEIHGRIVQTVVQRANHNSITVDFVSGVIATDSSVESYPGDCKASITLEWPERLITSAGGACLADMLNVITRFFHGTITAEGVPATTYIPWMSQGGKRY